MTWVDKEMTPSEKRRDARLADVVVALQRLRSNIHACNRNPIPSARRLEWRNAVDEILSLAVGAETYLDRQPITDDLARLQNCTHDWATDGLGDYCRRCGKRE